MTTKPVLGISGCLTGSAVRFDGGHKRMGFVMDELAQWVSFRPVCPEMAIGLPTPRPPAEIPGGQGGAVLEGRLPVLTDDGADVTAAFVAGAEIALRLVQQHGLRVAVLKARSPSCGNTHNYDGHFDGTLVAGEGVTAALLKRHGVRVFNETQLAEAAAELARLEQGDD